MLDHAQADELVLSIPRVFEHSEAHTKATSPPEVLATVTTTDGPKRLQGCLSEFVVTNVANAALGDGEGGRFKSNGRSNVCSALLTLN